MARIEADNGFQLSPGLLEAVHKAAAYRDLEKSDGYRRLLDFMEKRSNLRLAAMREAPLAEDRIQLQLQLMWRESEKALEDIQIEIQHGIAMGREIAEELDRSALIDAGLPMDFGSNE